MRKIFVLLAIIGFLVYSSSLFNGFVWDDEEQVVNNTIVHSVRNIPLFFQGSTFNTGGSGGLSGIYYKPVMSIVFSFVYTFFGPRAVFFHLFQVIIHIANAYLVFLFLEKLLKAKKLSLLLSIVFLVHPISVETVSYIAAYQEVLFFFFGMVALLSSDKLLVACLFLLLSVLSKETGILFFIALFLYYFFFEKKRVLSYGVFASFVLGVYALLRFAIAAVPLSTQHLSPITRVDLTTRIITIPKIVFFYISTFLFPKDLAIAQHWVVRSLTWNDFYKPFLFDVVFMSGLCSLLFLFKKNRVFVFFFIWFLIGLGIHLQIFPLDMTVADRWFYFPMVGLLGIIGLLAKQIGRYQKIHTQAIIIASIITVLGLRTFMRNFDWKNGLTLFSRDIKISRDAFDLENNLGVELYRAGRVDLAKTHFERSAQLAPYWWTNWNNLGAVYDRRKDLARAEEYYKKAIDNGDYYLAYENYASVLIRQKKLSEARRFLEKQALVRFPYNQTLHKMYQYLSGSN